QSMEEGAARARQTQDDTRHLHWLPQDFRVAFDVSDHPQPADQSFDNDLGLRGDAGRGQARLAVGGLEKAIHGLYEPQIAEVGQPGSLTRLLQQLLPIEERGPVGLALSHQTSPSSVSTMIWAASCADISVVSICTSGFAGGSYGLSMPVKFFSWPERAFLYKPFTSRASATESGVSMNTSTNSPSGSMARTISRSALKGEMK